MSLNSIHTNSMAFTALASLNRINAELEAVMKQVTTGFKVNDAFDGGAAFAVAQGLRSDIKANEAVIGRIASAMGTIAVANEAATKVSDALTRMKGTLLVLADDNLTAESRSLYQSQYDSIISEIQGYINQASFGGTNLLNSASGISVLTGANGSSTPVQGFDLNADVIAQLGSSPATAADAKNLLSGGFQTAQQNIGAAMSALGDSNTRLKSQKDFVTALNDATEMGLGAIVDADLAKASAKLQSLQIQQQLATQMLQIANRSKDYLLQLFNGIGSRGIRVNVSVYA